MQKLKKLVIVAVLAGGVVGTALPALSLVESFASHHESAVAHLDRGGDDAHIEWEDPVGQ